ncbi:MAG: FecR domain-containing protein [Devosia sp.]
MLKSLAAAAVLTVVTALSLSTAMADDWTAVRLRGGVFALENGEWTQLLRGSVVPDDRVIKSAPGGRITLVRGAETIEFGPDTTAQISDRSGFTTVYNHEGTVGVDAEARNVKHFAVQTPFLAAVVKGTAFTVQTSPKASIVAVTRGNVEVDDAQNDTSVSVVAGQQVSSSQDTPITLASVIAAPGDAPKPPQPAAQQPAVTQVIQSARKSGEKDTAGKFGNDNQGKSGVAGHRAGNSDRGNAGWASNENSRNSAAGARSSDNSGKSESGRHDSDNSGRSNSGRRDSDSSGRGDSGGHGSYSSDRGDSGKHDGGHGKDSRR